VHLVAVGCASCRVVGSRRGAVPGDRLRCSVGDAFGAQDMPVRLSCWLRWLQVIVSTDVMARGVDLDRVNLVVNMDVPLEAATYMHRWV
jgi:hypothetical protein